MQLYFIIFSFVLDFISFIFLSIIFAKNFGISTPYISYKNKKYKSKEIKKLITQRELEVLEKIYQNPKLPYKQIASLLFISDATIYFHLNNISKKINIKTRKENLLNFYEKNYLFDVN